jgi:nitrate/nitrite transporter NarK
MVGAVVAFIPEYFRRNFRDFAGSPAISGIGRRERGGGGQHGGSRQHRERIWKGVLGLGVRFDYQKSNLRRDVSRAGDTFLDSAQHQFPYFIDDRRLLRAHVLWRRIWDHACLCGRLLWIEECNVGPIYGLVLTAWGFASAFGPLLIAYMQQISGTYRGALHVIAVVMAASMILPLIVSPPRRAEEKARAQAPQRSRLPAA